MSIIQTDYRKIERERIADILPQIYCIIMSKNKILHPRVDNEIIEIKSKVSDQDVINNLLKIIKIEIFLECRGT